MTPHMDSAWLEDENGGRIPMHGHCTFGRTPGNTVVLAVPKMSRRHAMIHEQGGEFWMVDLGSTNGVLVNGERVTHPLRLKGGDQLQFPGGVFVFRQTEASPIRTATQTDVTLPEIRMVDCWILVADLKGFTRLSQQMAAAELAPLVGKWMAHCQEILAARKGVVAKFLGDGFLAYWTAREETAPLIAEACQEFQVLRESAPLPFRLVLHRGEISFGGNSPDASNTMIGPELNFAFRLEKVASRLGLLWLFSENAATGLDRHLALASCGLQHVPDFEPERACFTLQE
jgi:class 3 adenylate cyclase